MPLRIFVPIWREGLWGLCRSMFRSKTVFVLGAGASKEFGLPLGAELAGSIASMMDFQHDTLGGLTGGDQSLFRAVARKDGDQQRTYNAARRIAQGLALRKSIDDFLDIHQGQGTVSLLGKAAIVKSIMRAEQHSRLSHGRGGTTIDFANLPPNWLLALIHLLRGQDPGTMFQNLSFISFNYDRTLEHFLFHAVSALFGVTEVRAKEILRPLSIIHPYGTVAKLHWQDGALPFGVQPSDSACIELAQYIRTYTEEVDAGEQLALIHALLHEATTIVFLGFAYHEQNIKLLTPKLRLQRKRIYGTAHGISRADVETVKMMLSEMFETRFHSDIMQYSIIGNDLTCLKLLQDYGLTLPRI
jgi:hypothetical protein